jgi:phosphotriesterase-related protein
MPAVNTVLGPIAAADFGITLMHEHTVIGPVNWDKQAGNYGRNIQELAKPVITAMEDAKRYGVKTMVIASPYDLGRSVELDKMVAGETGINIITSTGMYMQPGDLPAGRSEKETIDRLYERFMQEITRGIGTSGIKAGVIKAATSFRRIFPYEEAILKAAARACRDSGVPIITHTQDGTMGPEQAKLLTREGADPRKVVIGHMCGNANLEYQVATLESDISVSFDRWGCGIIFPDVMRQATLSGLLGIGFAGRIVLSHDYIPAWVLPQPELPDLARPLMAEWSYTHIFRNIIPRLESAGVTDAQVNSMLVDNPRRIFE